ncbi:sortilin (neurotensin receptor 3) [Aquimarina sp. MAR_2010_214]|uniref:VPS10 domain-containing protein n=1 Tax=Aquimarina sp. MAR_2010_214 TaxID=1250026 RepID=UPI000C707CEF|nr:glycosyl hydrolase [Aquimarina sp. MAR_2010_214]PKV48655.1 sortilin (neurotensin receptor 3) [Aquimarina sp. MAR_2010_214]
MKKFTSSLFFLFLSFFLFSQQPATNTELVQNGLLKKKQMEKTSLVKQVPFKNIGPTVMSGRVVDVDVNPENTTEFYVGYASGGLWYTTNNGTTFEPVLDTAETINVGDIAVDWKNNTIWVGTGENNSSRSSYAGVGILKSTDKGKTWKNVGLPDSHHIGRIIINPNNPDEVVVGVTGHLYSSNEERGVYKTTDGGVTWKKTLFINDQTGIIDLAYAPDNFNIIYAAAWDKDRKAWNFDGSGLGSGIYKSTDAGMTWNKISIDGSGFPTGEGVGRIGLAVFNENTLYAVHDSQFRRDKSDTKKSSTGLTKEDFKIMLPEAFLKLENKKLNAFLKTNGFHEKYRADNIKQLVRSGTVKPIDLAKYLENANAILFDTPVIGAEVYRSDDGGKSWVKTHKDYIDDLFYSYGYYFAQIQVSPVNKDHIYISGVPILKSKDAGKTFTNINRKNVHADHHSLWINPKNPMHLVNGNDGGLNISYDDGENWIKANQPSVGQFYAINIDHEKPYNVYGGLQDNGVWVGAHNAKEDESWHQSGHYPWESIMGGDGMQVQIDDRDANIVYTGFQFGNYFRINRVENKQTYIQPKHELGESPYRFNWQTPILLSSHNQDILYLGGNKLMRSMNQGDEWTAISNDLTNGGKKGNVAYGTLTAIAESIFQFGLIYTGSDDGLVYITKNSGGNWNKISDSFPKDLWVSRVIASSHKKERVYVTLNGYRWDDFKPYVYVSENYGQSWKNIGNDLPVSAINVIKEDPKNENVVYIGTDNGAYVSLDRGANWQAFSNGLPNVAVHDIVIQPEANDLLLGTHGRSIYKTNIKAIQLLDNEIMNKELHVFDISEMKWSDRWGVSWSKWVTPYEPTMTIKFYSGKSGDFAIKIITEEGKILQEFSTKADKGLNHVEYDLTITEKGKNILEKEFPDEEVSKRKNGKYYLPTGRYSIEISADKQMEKVNFELN